MAANALKLVDSIPFAYPEIHSDPEKLLAGYFSSSTLGICILDSGFRYVAINDTLAEMNGFPAASHLGKTVRDVLEAVADQIEPVLRRVLDTGEPVLNLELSAVLPTRKELGYWIEHFFPFKNAAGEVTRVGVIVAETTQQKRTQETLQQLSGTLKHQKAQLQMLLDVSSILSSNWNIEQVFPRISARIRRVFRQEYAGFSVHDADSGLLIQEAEDFPLRKGQWWSSPLSTNDSPGGRSLQAGSTLVFSQEQMQSFNAEIAQQFDAEGLQSLCCVPLLRPRG